ncbi:Pentapeptide repeats (9 copies) [uncultured archaeon]|nr:Pentapeptide repeats (9 copies) [uncultured archaeon]
MEAEYLRRIWVPILLAFLFMIGISVGISDNRVLPANDVLIKMKTVGQLVDFDNCTIVGDLIIPSIEDKEVHFNHTIFQNSVNSEDTTFGKTAYFRGAKFNGTADFKGSNFTQDANFVYSEFKGTTYFGDIYKPGSGARFNGPAYFEASNFSDAYFRFSNFNYVSFDGSKFNGITDFTGSNFSRFYSQKSDFYGDTKFGYSNFNGPFYLWGSNFTKDVTFQYSNFYEYASFSESKFNGEAIIGYINFYGDTDFSSSYFNGSADFENSAFSKQANFDSIVFKGYSIFNNSQFKGDALFENTTFRERLSLTRTRYDKLYIRWNSIKSGLTYDDAAYMSLLKNFKDLGYFEDYDSCYFQYRKEHRGQPWPLVNGLDQPIRKCIDFFLEWFYGYGTKPLNAFYFSIVIIIVFGIFWRAIGLGGSDDVTSEDHEDWPDGLFDVLSFSTTIFLSGTKLFIDPPQLSRR